jgi:hypothetical protein
LAADDESVLAEDNPAVKKNVPFAMFPVAASAGVGASGNWEFETPIGRVSATGACALRTAKSELAATGALESSWVISMIAAVVVGPGCAKLGAAHTNITPPIFSNSPNSQ